MSRRDDWREQGRRRSRQGLSAFSLLLLHAACYLLVVFYVNMFQLWAWLSRVLGPGLLTRMLPVAVTVVVLLLVALRFADRVNRGYSIRPVYLALGLACAIFSLAIPDPEVPIKRIHVAEYLVLSFLVRHTLSHRLQGGQLLLFSALVTLLLGIHDEMLQGLHPQRYYGWRDMIVNGAAGLGGALLGHGLFCCVRPEIEEARARVRGPALLAALFLLLAAATTWLVASLYLHRGQTLPLPALLPQAAVGLLFILLRPDLVFSSRLQHGLQVLFWLTFGLLAYPLAARLAGLPFV